MSKIILYGFPLSTFVNVARLVLAEKGVAYTFCDIETEMGSPWHLSLHPFNRVPILEHDGFRLYETAAIIGYADETFAGPRLTPADVRARARMNQWIGALSAYYYPYVAFHLGHERIVYPALGIAPDEKVVAAALPRIELALEAMERELADGRPFLVGKAVTLADLAHTPCMTTLSLTPEGQAMLARKPLIGAWRARMAARASVQTVLAAVAPYIGKPVAHARAWVNGHRPYYP